MKRVVQPANDVLHCAGSRSCVVFRGLTRGRTLTADDVLLPEGSTSSQLAITDFIPWDTLSGAGVS